MFDIFIIKSKIRWFFKVFLWYKIDVVFLYFFALIAEKGFLISPCYSLESCIQMGIFFLFFSLLFFSQLSIRPSQTASLLFCIFFFLGMVLIPSPVRCHEPPSIVHQALCDAEQIQNIIDKDILKSRWPPSYNFFWIKWSLLNRDWGSVIYLIF